MNGTGSPSSDPGPYSDWLRRVSPEFSWGWRHLDHVRDHLADVTLGACRRLILSMPPQHGKSEGLTVRYPVWRLCRNHRLRVAVGAYNQTHANRFSRKSRKLARDLLPLSAERKAANEWETAAGGTFVAVGVGAGITGLPVDLLVIDDPVKNREEADSPAHQERVWEWYMDDLTTRLQHGAPVIVVMCMAGDTRVLMADGTEQELRHVRPGDAVASYDAGRLVAAKVLNWKNQGPDRTYAISMASGIIVRANERHPFLVERDGVRTWVRLRNLKVGDRVIRVTGGNGGASCAKPMGAASRPGAAGSAPRITTSGGGRRGIGRRRSTHGPVETCGSAGTTVSGWPSTKSCSPSRAASVPSAESRPATTCGRTGAGSCALTTTTTPAESEGCCATTATSLSGTARLHATSSLPLDTYAITCDIIEAIEPAGIEDVFDIQVEATENFIANGLVSHNTRWHEADLAGKILASEDGPNWRYVRLPALAEEGDPLGRAPGEPLCPELHPLADLEEKRRVMGEGFTGLYQQLPVPRGGLFFRRDWFKVVAEPFGGRPRRVRYWDLAAATKDTSCYTAGVLVAAQDGRYRVEDVARVRLPPAERNEAIRRTAELDAGRPGFERTWFEEQPGAAGIETSQALIRSLSGLPVRSDRVTGSKQSRAEPLADAARGGLAEVVDAHWTAAYLSELASFPRGQFADQVDSSSGAFNKLTRAAGVRVIEG